MVGRNNKKLITSIRFPPLHWRGHRATQYREQEGTTLARSDVKYINIERACFHRRAIQRAPIWKRYDFLPPTGATDAACAMLRFSCVCLTECGCRGGHRNPFLTIKGRNFWGARQRKDLSRSWRRKLSMRATFDGNAENDNCHSSISYFIAET